MSEELLEELMVDFVPAIYVIPFTGLTDETHLKDNEIITGCETLPFTGISDVSVKLNKKVVTDFSTVRKINIGINIVNYIFTVILSIITLRFAFLIFGVKDNIIYKITNLLLFPVFHLLGTVPSVSPPHVERESLVAIALYAIIVSFVSVLAGLVKKIVKKRMT
ncbi:MAG: hypothetical protein ABRQ39_08420 [Candidatus Eremiobacterota bacterium]